MRINKQISSSLLLVLSVLVMTSVVSAVGVVTINTPAASSTVSGATYMLNVSVDAEAGNFSCEIYAQSTLTANNSWDLVATIVNGTEDPDYANATFDSNMLEDANNYIFNASCTNDSDVWADVTNTGITINNTVPTAATSLSPTSDSDGSVTFSGTVTDSETTSCTLIFDGINPGSSSYSMTYATTSCSHTLSSVPEGIYTWKIRASDESDTTDSSTQQTNVDVQTSAGKAALLAQQQNVQPRGGALLAVTDVPVIGSTLETIGGWPTVIVAIVIITVIMVIRRR